MERKGRKWATPENEGQCHLLGQMFILSLISEQEPINMEMQCI